MPQIKYAENPLAIPRQSWRGELAANSSGAIFVGTQNHGGESLLVGVNSGVRSIALEDILSGCFVNLSSNSGTIFAKLASLPADVCHGFAIDGAATGGETIICVLHGSIISNPQVLETGYGEYYLSIAPGYGSIQQSSQFLGNSIGDKLIFAPQSA